MKKHITLLSCLCLAGTFYAQKNIEASRMVSGVCTFDSKEVTSKGSTSGPAKALGTPLWSSDFTDANEWVFDNDGQTGPNFGWNINATKQGWVNDTYMPIINSTSHGNFAELVNGNAGANPGTQVMGVDYYLTSAAPVAITTNNLIFSFMQNGARWNDHQEFQVSINGTDWISVGNNDDKPSLSSLADIYPNPEVISISLAEFIPANATTLWVRFHWTSLFTTGPNSTNPAAWGVYGWHIDDVAISTPADYDLERTYEQWGSAGLNYFQIPNTQIAPIEFSTEVRNIGADPLTNVTFGVNVNSGVFTNTTAPVTINPLETDSLFTTNFTPSGNGTYSVVRTLSMTETDDVPTNNAAFPVITFDVVDYIYARDNNVPAGSVTYTDGMETGNLFDIYTNQEVKGVDVRIDGDSPDNIEAYTTIYVWSGAAWEYAAGSDPVVIAPSDMDHSDYTIMLEEPYTMEAGKTYLVMVGSYEPDLVIATAGNSVPQTSFVTHGNDWTVLPVEQRFYTTNTPMVRLNFDPTLSADEIADVATNVLASPNPFNNETNVSFNLKNSAEVSLVVTDLAGRTVFTSEAATMNAGTQVITIDGSAFGAGMYNYTLTIEGKSITNHIVKK